MMNPTSEQLGQNVQPLVRDYVKAIVTEELLKERNTVHETLARANQLLAEASALRAEAQARVDKIEAKLRSDPAYEITKMKIVRLMQELNLE